MFILTGCGYPPPFDAPCMAHPRRRIGDAGGLDDTCSDFDMMRSNADGRFVHKDGMPYP
jgi:hypothetical protein